MKVWMIAGAFFMVLVSPVFAEERLACQDEYEQSYNAYMDAMDDPNKAPEMEQTQKVFYSCLASYESQHGKQATEELSVKLKSIEP